MSDGRATVVYRVFVTVTAVNDAPVRSGTAIAVGRDQTVTGTLPPAFDVEGSPITYPSWDPPQPAGVVTVNPDGHYTYAGGRRHEGADSFTFTVSDGDATSTTHRRDSRGRSGAADRATGTAAR